MTEDQLYTATKKFITSETAVLGLSTTFIASTEEYTWVDGSRHPFPEHIISVARRIKAEYPALKIVIGGYGSDHRYMFGIPHATIMSYTSATEDIFLEYLDHCKKGTPLPLGKLITQYTGELIGATTKHRMHYNTARTSVYSIETDDFVWRDKDLILDDESLPLDLSRGCIFACRFCQFPHLGKSKLDYLRRMEYVKEELISNYEKFKITKYMVLDDTFNDTEHKLRLFNDMVSTLPFKITYSAYIRADLIHRFPDTAYMLKESGLFGSFNGLESLNPYASKLVGKAWSGKHAREFIPQLYHDIWKSEVPMLLSFIIGLPKETVVDVFSTAKWVKENNLYSAVFHKLGLFSTATNVQHTILSEFDKNYSKYGFSFDSNEKWYNETWTEQGAGRVTTDMGKYLYREGINKISTWNLGNMLSYGFSKQYLIDTPINSIDYAVISKCSTERFINYYNRLIGL